MSVRHHHYSAPQSAEDESATQHINVILNWFEELKRLVPTGGRD